MAPQPSNPADVTDVEPSQHGNARRTAGSLNPTLIALAPPDLRRKQMAMQ
jgi:hypothetical protein